MHFFIANIFSICVVIVHLKFLNLPLYMIYVYLKEK